MTVSVSPMEPAALGRIRVWPDAGVGALRTERGNLPLDRLDVRATITGLVYDTVVTTEFVNVHDVPLEATYVFPLPDRAAVTGMSMTAADRTVRAELRERAAAREAYDRALDAGHRAAIAEEERPDVFTMRVGNLGPGERATVELRMAGPLPYEDGAAVFRFPLVVAPRYVPGTGLPGPAVGDGQSLDTDAVPDASRISPPVLLPGFPSPLRLSLEVGIDPAGLDLGEVTASLHTVTRSGNRVAIAPGEKADRDFILRLPYAEAGESAVAVPDPGQAAAEGTYRLTVVPPDDDRTRRPKDVVLLLDRSGSMAGWKMVAARRAAARVVDTLTARDRFAVRTFDHLVERPDELGATLAEATDRNRFRAVEHLSRAVARGGTELLTPLRDGLGLLGASSEGLGPLASGGPRDRVLVLVTDGQVAGEDQILQEIAPLVGAVRVHAVGIDRAVNAGFLGRLAARGAGRAELVESEDRLDAAMDRIHRRIGAPVVTDVRVEADGLTLVPDTRSPARVNALFAGVPLVVSGRYTGAAGGSLTVVGRTADDGEFRRTVPVSAPAARPFPALAALWARDRLRDLEDRYAAGEHGLEAEIVATSLRFGVLCRFTAYVAVDDRAAQDGGPQRRVIQPVELPSGWAGSDEAQPMLLAGSPSPARPPGIGGPAGSPARPGFAPVQARARHDGPAAARTFAAGLGAAPTSRAMIRAARPGPASSGAVTVPQLRELAATEAARLRDDADRPARERRDILDDLLSRLTVLLGDSADPAYAPLRELLGVLTGDGSLDERWATATAVLTAFGESGESGGAGGSGHDRRAFWKR
ncbi:VIT domain-containing protein [Mangrovihabitans endophyticus]|uniref:Ca-activated chloride channel family protein n=1 Tax=Mangrovihabitans endophyticus TaxID=1751298 RepID=A0A8J3FSG1_9ACTN|nr:VIT domain-containing protein [Mangrovihabitans endophyticus]GGL19311.1 hypothetical protein GCM10012284_62300 [Mangrovihabitans endophyticus]